MTPYYNPMIGKLIAWGETRSEACARMKEALKNYEIEGIKTNIPMPIQTVSHEQFLLGYSTTDFVNKYYFPQKITTT